VTGYLDRLVRRAHGEPTGLRPRQAAAFEPAPLLPETETFEVGVRGGAIGPPPAALPTVAPRADSRRTTDVGVGRPGAPSARMPAPPPAAAAMNSRPPSSQQADDSASGPRQQPPQQVIRETDAVASSQLPTPSSPGQDTTYERAAVTSTRQAPEAIPATPRPRAAAPALAKVAPTRAFRELPPRRPAPAPQPDTVIEVRIGRVEVAPAPAPLARPAPRVKVQRPPVELSDYLKARRSRR
jgi:hypothetical protein